MSTGSYAVIRVWTPARFRFSTAFVLFYATFATTIAQDRFSVNLFVEDNGGKKDTLIFGVARGATYCIDAFLGEVEQPPKPPQGVFDARWVDNRSGGGACLGQGIVVNYTGYLDGYTDTARVAFQPGDGGYPFTFSWSGELYWLARMEFKTSEGSVDMLTTTSSEVTSEDVISARVIFREGIIDDVGPDAPTPTSFSLMQNYPNPFNPTTTMRYAIERIAGTEISVFDLLGRRISTLVSEELSPGYYHVTWNGTDERGGAATSGVYHIRMEAQYQDGDGWLRRFADTRKITLIR